MSRRTLPRTGPAGVTHHDFGYFDVEIGRIDEGGRLIEKRAPLVLPNLVENPFA